MGEHGPRIPRVKKEGGFQSVVQSPTIGEEKLTENSKFQDQLTD